MNRKHYFSLILIVFLLAVNYNQDFIGGMSAVNSRYLPENARLNNDLSELSEYSYIDRSINRFMRYWDLKGASVAIAREGRLVFAKGYGSISDKNDIRIQPYNKFRIASVSKLITATAIMKLCEEGKLSADEKVFGPGAILDREPFRNLHDKRAMNISVAHLLAHQAGWSQRYGDHMFMPDVVADFLDIELPVSTEDIIRFALAKRLHFTPGYGRSYSNLGYSILGLVIAEVSGVSYEEYCRTEIFEPLGLFDFELAENLYEHRDLYEVKYYEASDAIPKKSIYGTDEILPTSYGGNDIRALGGAGAWIATAPDLLRFMLAIDGFDTQEDILSKQSVNFMTNRKNGFAPLGWKASTPQGYWWRTGSFGGTSAMIKRQPDGTAWVMLLNTSTWKSSMFTSDVNYIMSRVVRNTKSWTNTNLFDYSLPLPIDPYLYPEQVPNKENN